MTLRAPQIPAVLAHGENLLWVLPTGTFIVGVVSMLLARFFFGRVKISRQRRHAAELGAKLDRSVLRILTYGATLFGIASLVISLMFITAAVYDTFFDSKH